MNNNCVFVAIAIAIAMTTGAMSANASSSSTGKSKSKTAAGQLLQGALGQNVGPCAPAGSAATAATPNCNPQPGDADLQQVLLGNTSVQSASGQFKSEAMQMVGAQASAAAGKVLGGTPDDPLAQLGGQVTQTLLNQAAGQNGGKPLTSQLKDQTVQALSSQAGARVGQALAAPGADPSTQVLSQAGSQLTQTLINEVSGGGNGQSLTGQIKGQATQTVSSQVGARIGQTLGAQLGNSKARGLTADFAANVNNQLNQAMTGKLNQAMGGPQATATPTLRDGLQSAAATTLVNPVAQKLSQSVSASKQPLVADLLQLSLQRTGAQLVGAANAGSFAPPANSALPISADALHSGINIVSSSSGKVGLGLKSAVSKKVELSGTLDPKSADGAAAGVQIKIGGN